MARIRLKIPGRMRLRSSGGAKPNSQRQTGGRRYSALPKAKFLKALEGSGGLKTEIAYRLGCSITALYNFLAKPEHEDMRQAFEKERETLGDIAEDTLKYCIEQRKDLPVASQSARWYLSRRCEARGYSDPDVKIGGGKKPIEVSNSISLDALNLPLDVRRAILQAIEKQQAEQPKE